MQVNGKVLKLILLLLHLQTASTHMFRHLKDLIKFLNRLHGYETITIFVSEELWPDTDDLFPLLGAEEESSMKPKLIISTNFSSQVRIERILSGSLLTLVLADNHESYIMEIATTELRGIRHNPLLFYVQHTPDQLEDNLNRFCQWTRATQFVNSLLLFSDSDKKYGCKIYPDLQVVDQTEWPIFEMLSNSPRGKSLDLKGKVVKVPVVDDKPRLFARSYDVVSKKLELSGVCWKVFKAYIQHSNGKIHPYPLYEPGEKYRSIDEILDMLENKTLICTPHCFAGVDLERFSESQPVQVVDWCFMVPVIGKVPRYEYILTPFPSETRLVLLLTIIVTGGMLWLLGERNSFSLGLLNSFCGYFALGFSSNLDGIHKWISRCIQMMIRVAGFIFSNYYNTLLASFLATTLFGKQIDTLMELITSNLQIVLRREDFEDLTELDLPEELLENLHVTSRTVVSELREQLNSTYGYMVASDRWDFHKFQQEKMSLNNLRLTEICYAKYLLTFPLWYDNMFKEPFSSYILRSIQGGLISYWTEQSYRDFQKTGALNTTYVADEATPMDVVYFTYAWLCLLFGLGCSSAMFILEITYDNL